MAENKIFFGACLLLPLALLASGAAEASPLLRCEVSYAGATHTVEASPAADPYGVAARDIAGRFSFKAVVIGDDQYVDYIKLYAYYQTRRQPVLLHQAKYLPPFTASSSPYALTGTHFLYSPDLGRELQYRCTLQGMRQ